MSVRCPVLPPHQLGTLAKDRWSLGTYAVSLKGPVPIAVVGLVHHVLSVSLGMTFWSTTEAVQSASSVSQYPAGG